MSLAKKYTVDRIEDGAIAVLLLKEDESEQVDIPVSALPSNLKEGDILLLSLNGNEVVDAIIMHEETRSQKEKARLLREKVRRKN